MSEIEQILIFFLLQEKWVPLHSLAASGAFYLVDALLKHNANVNAADKVHKQPVYLLMDC